MEIRHQVSTGFSSNLNRSNSQKSRHPESDDEEDMVPIKRESSQRKAKEGNLGTIHISRRHFCSTKLNLAILTPNFFNKICFFHQIKKKYFSTLHFDKIFMLKFEIFST